jgi:hypothetical protein
MQSYYKKHLVYLGLMPILLILFLFPHTAKSQIGGRNTYEFLNLTTSARAAAMGGSLIAVKDDDIGLVLLNPSIITENMNNNITFSFIDFYAGINYGFASYAKSYDKIGTFATSVQYVNYGSFNYADFSGNLQGEFSSSEFALVMGWDRQLSPRFSIGANMKFIYSSLESYSSYGIAVDLAVTYYNDASQFTSTLLIKNIGRQLKSYRSGNLEPLPFEIQLGISKKLRHIPFMYSVVFTHLEKWDLTYTNSLHVQNVIGDGVSNITNMGFAKKIFSHIVIGGEFLIGKNFSLRIGYNYRKRQEMKVESRNAMIGFSWGFGFRISKFQFNYARSTYHLIGSPNYITITTNVNELFQ